MDKHTEQFSRLAKQVFGPDSRCETSSGTRIKPGAVTIILADKIIGSAPTFQGALRQATKEIGLQSSREKPQPLASGLTLGAAFDRAGTGIG